MEELITARQYAKLTARSPRTVQWWVEDKKKEPQNIPGVVRVGKAFAATWETWQGIADKKGSQGRRDNGSRKRKKDPEQQ